MNGTCAGSSIFVAAARGVEKRKINKNKRERRKKRRRERKREDAISLKK